MHALVGRSAPNPNEVLDLYLDQPMPYHFQPMLGLHGHIHEAKGVRKIGRTMCMNPGSEYSEAILRGIIVNLDEKGVKSYQTTSG